MIDVLFISPGNTSVIYQDLSKNYTTVEPPTWALLLAQSCRSHGFSVDLMDINAENLSDEEVYDRVQMLNPRLVVFVVYGQNVNAGTVSMSGAVKTSTFLKSKNLDCLVSFVGSYPQALPKKCLEEEKSIDFVFTNEGVYALWTVLSNPVIDLNSIAGCKGVAWRDGSSVVINSPEAIVPQNRMDLDLPGYAWDLLPYTEKPFDLYRAPMWHSEYDEDKRSPYAALQTSLGCQFKCSFCMINIMNRSDEEEVGVASNYSGMRFWSPEFIIKEFDNLVELGVKTIKITDEMFLLNKKYYLPLCNLLASRDYADDLLMWSYSRIDTVRDPKTLSLLRRAGIRWLALGIESADRKVRLEVSKGKFEDVDIAEVVDQVHEAGINVMANYIFGLPGDTQESMRATLDLSKDLCTAGWNAYGAMALPGSELYAEALREGRDLPISYAGYSFYGYDTLPLSNGVLSSAEILKFRDEAFEEYHSHPQYLDLIESSFGSQAKDNIVNMLKVKLKRKLLEC
jgi:anaerobic magnesium-protoporphyrin IX monomethyl ester cyclase